MKKLVLKLFALVLAAMLCFCSCEYVKQAADGALASAGAEISGALDEGRKEIGEGLNELAEATAELTSVITSVSEELESVRGSVGDELAGVGSSVSGVIDSALSEAAGEIAAEMTEVPGFSEDADTTTVPEAKRYTFRNKKKYDEHYEKHGAEFGDITKEEYLDMANELINSTSDSVLHKMSKDGDYLFFDRDTGYFLVLSDDDYIRTFFIPTAGEKYYDKQ
ncbi:MAG: hypothetical protein IJT87_12155 [Ruminiclostridium sp.]|nr:hypothetical protein [Ruminiclostridium sp.]